MYDGRGSVTQLTNAKGNVSDKYRYTPFGEPMEGGQLSPNTKLLNNPYGYNGEYHDLESGFQYLRARYYNPETARFITRDSYLGQINEPLTLNRYAYTSNNPVKYKDPSGHINLEAGGGGSSSSTYSISTSSSTATKAVSSRPLLQKGSDNKEEVRTLQTMLKTIGYYIGKSGVDGIFGKDTDAAVRAFQGDTGLEVDGKVGVNTWTKVEKIYNNVIGTGIIPDNVSQGPNGSGGNSGNFVNSKVVEAEGSSKNSNACDDLGGGFASDSGAYGPEDPGEAYIKRYDPSKINPLLYTSSRDGNLPDSLQKIIIKYSYEYNKADNTDDKKRALTELSYYRGLGNNPVTRKYYEVADYKNENEQLIEVLMLYAMVRSGLKTKLLSIEGAAEAENIAGKTKYDNININSLKEQELAQITSDIRRNGGSPIEIPENATIKAQSKNAGYEQISYKWSDETYTYEARWHTETPGAAQYGRGTTWVVNRIIPGNANGVQKVVQVKVGDTWVDNSIWQQAVRANQTGTATQEQMNMLENGHWLAK